MARAEKKGRRSPSQERSRQTVEVILEAAARVLIKEGYDAASTNRIAKVAGVSVGSLYQYFPSKETLIAELIDRQADEMLGLAVSRVAEVASEPLEVAGREVVRTIFGVFARKAELNRVLLEQIQKVGRLDKLRDMEERAVKVLRLYLEMHRPRLRRPDLDMAALILVHLIDSLAIAFTLYHPDHLKSEAFSDEVADLVLSYLLAPDT